MKTSARADTLTRQREHTHERARTWEPKRAFSAPSLLKVRISRIDESISSALAATSSRASTTRLPHFICG